MRAKLALVLHLGGVGECGRLIWVWSVQAQESEDLQYGSFCWVGTMHVWGCVLEVSVLRADKCFHLVGRFIVQFVELRFEPLQYKPVVCFAVRLEEFFLGSVFDGD